MNNNRVNTTSVLVNINEEIDRDMEQIWEGSLGMVHVPACEILQYIFKHMFNYTRVFHFF